MEPVASLQSSQQHVPFHSLVNPVHTLPPYFFMIDFNIILPSTSRSLKLLRSFRIPHQNSVCISLLPHTCYMPSPPRAPWCDPIIAFGAEYKSRRYSLCNVLQSPVTSSRHPPFGHTLFLRSSLETEFHTHTKQQTKLWSCIFNIYVSTLPVYGVSLWAYKISQTYLKCFVTYCHHTQNYTRISEHTSWERAPLHNLIIS